MADAPGVESRPKRILEGFEGEVDGEKRMRVENSETASEGTRTYNSECSNILEGKCDGQGQGNHARVETSSQITEENVPTHLDVPINVPAVNIFLEPNVRISSLGYADGCQPSAKHGSNATSRHHEEMHEPYLPTKSNTDCHSLTRTLVGPKVGIIDASRTVEHNPFYPYKKLGKLKSTDASECGSTTGPLEESEPLRMWKEMKQNGFLSSSHGGVPMPKQRGRQSRKKKNDDRKKRTETAKKEQANKLTKIAAPSGLLSGLNPGIINHVRNSKQVHSIIEAIVRSEKLDGHLQNRFPDQEGTVNKENAERREKQNHAHNVSASQLNPFSSNSDYSMSSFSQHTSELNDDPLTRKLSSNVTMKSEDGSSGFINDPSENLDVLSSLSLKAASVASQWLELLQQDIKGRLAALHRSKKRVRNVIQIELPYVLSTEFSSNQENNPCFEQFNEAGDSKTTIHNMYVRRWKSLFSQMDRALTEEGKYMENWLRQVQEMQLHCDKGLKYASSDGFRLFDPLVDTRPKKPDALERECAVRAAAASIYSTSNLTMTKENVPCF
ncbi:hypothetical protein J5N97_019241 [Dioscorea zingiberensis]|uniref:Uncharacterized protein n=1 Tax=Dioscorea zingiberensis TaxID=325984 RepID=A0A9D5HCI7_9LILI|nr:hypothetical protein J5N97_019241 [Dioscorea zingiberensis]